MSGPLKENFGDAEFGNKLMTIAQECFAAWLQKPWCSVEFILLLHMVALHALHLPPHICNMIHQAETQDGYSDWEPPSEDH